MSKFMNRVIGRIIRDSSRLLLMTGMLLHSEAVPEASEAIASLKQLSPDPGGSCWTDQSFECRERSLLLSVIVPAYNVEKYIVDCMESILRQQVSFDYEVIVVNDGSTDTTSVLLKQYENHERVHILHQENQGLSAARNAGINCSRGEYLCFVDSDDELLDGALEALTGIAVQKKAKLVVGSYEKRLRNGKLQYIKQLGDQKADIAKLPGFAHGRVIHYSVFQNLRFPEGYWFEDSIMAQIVHPLCQNSAYTISHICYEYYSNESGISASSRGKGKSLDSLWITMRLLQERKLFGLDNTKQSYEYFLSMVNLTYQRTKFLGTEVAKCIFAVQRMLMNQYYARNLFLSSHKKMQTQEALRKNDFRKYILACERKH